MHNYAADNARKKLLARFTGKADDGRGYARPGDKDLWLHATGARVEALIPMDDGSVIIRFSFEQAAGWHVAADGEREALPGRLSCYEAGVQCPMPGRGYFSGTVWALWTWMNECTPIEVYAALGRWTVILAPTMPWRKGGVRSALLPTFVPPDSEIAETCAGPEDVRPEGHPDRDTIRKWLDENTAVAVCLYMSNDDGRTAYVRQWLMPKHRAQDFAGMMTHRFGEAVEAITDMAAVASHADEVILTGNGGPFDREDDGDER